MAETTIRGMFHGVRKEKCASRFARKPMLAGNSRIKEVAELEQRIEKLEASHGKTE